MNPIGIILVFAFLALLVILGIALAGVGAFKLRQLVRGGFTGSATIVTLSWQSALIFAGLLFTSYGIFAGYRLVWGS